MTLGNLMSGRGLPPPAPGTPTPQPSALGAAAPIMTLPKHMSMPGRAAISMMRAQPAPPPPAPATPAAPVAAPAAPPGIADAAHDAAIQAAMSGAGGDPAQAQAALAQSGLPAAAEKFRQQQVMSRISGLAQRMQAMQTEQAQYRVGTALLNAVNDDATYQVVKRLLVAVAGPQVAQAFGDNYEQAKPQLDQLKELWAQRAHLNTAHQQVATSLHAGLQAMHGDANSPDAEGHFTTALGGMLGRARSQGDWDTVMARAKELGMSPAVINKFAPAYTPQDAMRARLMGPPESHDVFLNS